MKSERLGRADALAVIGCCQVRFWRKGVKMRKYGTVIWISVLTVVLVWGIILPAYGQEKGKQEGALKETTGITITRLVVGTGVDKHEPVGVAEVFPGSTEKVYCFLEATGIAKDTEVSVVWFHGQKEMLKASLPLKMGPKWKGIKRGLESRDSRSGRKGSKRR
jgi:hypothetical protein